MTLKLVSKFVGHGVTTERYASAKSATVALIVSTSTWGDGSTHDDHFVVLDCDGNRSGIFYSREAAMKLAEAKAA